jgi:hypothetical protein
VTTLLQRKSRYTVLRANTDRRSSAVNGEWPCEGGSARCGETGRRPVGPTPAIFWGVETHLSPPQPKDVDGRGAQAAHKKIFFISRYKSLVTNVSLQIDSYA